MRILHVFLCILMAGSAAFAAEPSASAPASRTGIVDVDRVFKEYKATQAKEQELEKFSAAKKEEREKKVSEIRGLRDEMLLLNEENRAKQRQTLEEKLRDLASFDAQIKATLQDQRESAVGSLLTRIEKVVNSFAKERGYELVLSSRAVLYGTDGIDLTDEVVSILNQEYAKGEGGKR